MTDRHDEFDLPRPLRDALREMHRGPGVPGEVDERILYAAREGFARRVRTRAMVRRAAAVGGAVAAAVAIFFGVQAMQSRPTDQTVVSTDVYTRDGDVDQSGQVDILDALLLARKVEAGNAAWRRWEDLNRDGKVTAADVEQIAQAAVRLPFETGGTIQ